MKEGVMVRCSLPPRRNGKAAVATDSPNIPSPKATPTSSPSITSSSLTLIPRTTLALSPISTSSEVIAANGKVELLKARIAGFTARAAAVRLDAARRQAELAEARYKMGAADESELLDAREAAKLREAEIVGDPVQIAVVRLATAERVFRFTEIHFKAGEATALEAEAARNAVELRLAELRDAKAAKEKAPSPVSR